MSARTPDPQEIGFFELLRQLETDTQRFGRAGGPEREPARLGQNARLSFATSEIAGYEAQPQGGPTKIDVNAIGLFGPEGPMPLHLTRWIMARQSNRWFEGDSDGAASDTSFLEFCNLLQHRMIALYWRAWADAHPEVQIAHDTGGRVNSLLLTLGQIGMPGMSSTGSAQATQKIRHGTGLAHQVYSPVRLTRYLSDVLQSPVTLKEFIGGWTIIPSDLQSTLGGRYSQLGKSVVLGGRTYERSNHAEVQVGPMSLSRFVAFLEDRDLYDEVRHAIVFAIGEEMEIDLRLVLDRDEVPEARLGACQLGRTIWLNPEPEADLDDMCLTRIAGRIAETESTSYTRTAA